MTQWMSEPARLEPVPNEAARDGVLSGVGRAARIMLLLATPLAAMALGFLIALLVLTLPTLDWAEVAWDPSVAIWGCLALFVNFMVWAGPFSFILGLKRLLAPASFRGRLWRQLAEQLHRRRAAWLVGAAMMGAVVAARAVYSVNDRFDAATSVAARDTPHWRLKELLANREAIPDAENAAIVVSVAAARIPEKDQIAPGLRNIRDAIRNAEPNHRLDDETRGRIAAVATGCFDAIAIARRLAGYDRGAFPLATPSPMDVDSFPEEDAVRAIGLLLEIDAASLADEGRMLEAVDSCRAMIAVSRSVGDAPSTHAQLHRNAVGRSTVRTLERVLGQGEATDVALAGLAAAVSAELSEPSLLYGLRGDRAETDRRLETLGNHTFPFTRIDGSGGAYGSPIYYPLWWMWFTYQRTFALESTNRIVAIGHEPLARHERLWDEFEVWTNQIKTHRSASRLAAFALLLTPDSRPFDRSTQDYKAELGALVVLIAAERHRLQAGSWPKSIAEIDPGILPESPRDPYTGEPYQFHYVKGRLKVYSVGSNGVDEQGAFEPFHFTRGGADDAGVCGWDLELRGVPPKSIQVDLIP